MAEELSDFIEASGLLEYDPVAIASIYKKNPIRLVRRVWQTLLPIGLFLLGVGWEKLIGSLSIFRKMLSILSSKSCSIHAIASWLSKPGSWSCSCASSSKTVGGTISGLVESACPAFINAGPKSTRSCVNSLALKVFLSFFSK